MITADGMTDWQIALIAAGAAVVAAAAAVRLDRSLTIRRAGLVIAARRLRPGSAPPRPASRHGPQPTERPVHGTLTSRPPPHQARQTSWSSAATLPDNRAACLTTASAEPRRQR